MLMMKSRLLSLLHQSSLIIRVNIFIINRQSPLIHSSGQNVGVVIPSPSLISRDQRSNVSSSGVSSCSSPDHHQVVKKDSDKIIDSGSPSKSLTSSPGQIHENHLNQLAKDIPPPLPLRTSSILSQAVRVPLPSSSASSSFPFFERQQT